MDTTIQTRESSILANHPTTTIYRVVARPSTRNRWEFWGIPYTGADVLLRTSHRDYTYVAVNATLCTTKFAHMPDDPRGYLTFHSSFTAASKRAEIRTLAIEYPPADTDIVLDDGPFSADPDPLDCDPVAAETAPVEPRNRRGECLGLTTGLSIRDVAPDAPTDRPTPTSAVPGASPVGAATPIPAFAATDDRASHESALDTAPAKFTTAKWATPLIPVWGPATISAGQPWAAIDDALIRNDGAVIRIPRNPRQAVDKRLVYDDADWNLLGVVDGYAYYRADD